MTLQGRGKKGDGRCRRRPNRPPGGRTGWHRRFDLSIALAWTRPDHDGRGNGGTTDPPRPRPHPRWDRQPPRRPQVVTPAPSPRTCLSTVAAGAGGRGGWGGGRSAKSPVMRAPALSTSTAPHSPSLVKAFTPRHAHHRQFLLKAHRDRTFDGNSTELDGPQGAHRRRLSVGLRGELDGDLFEGHRWGFPSDPGPLQSRMYSDGHTIILSSHELCE